MSDHDAHERGSVEHALAWIAEHGIDARPWPTDRRPPHPTHRSTQPERAVLHLVEPGADPPRPGPLEDWVRLPTTAAELFARADVLLARVRRLRAHQVGVDDDGVLRVGDAIAILSPTEARLVTVLVERHGRLVTREELASRTWPDEDEPPVAWLNKHLRGLRARIAHLPMQLHTVRGLGLLLEVDAGAHDDEALPSGPVVGIGGRPVSFDDPSWLAEISGAPPVEAVGRPAG